MTRSRRRWLLAGLAVLAVAAGVAAVIGLDEEPGDDVRDISPTAEQLGSIGRPPAGWVAYDPASPFRRAVPDQPRVDPDSAEMVAKLFADGPADTLLVSDGESEANRRNDFARPLYFARPGDPAFRITCTDFGGDCPVAGETVRIPDEARPALGSDGHLTVLDRGQDWSFFRVQVKERGGGRLVVGNGARVRIDGDGLHGGGGAARFGGFAGRIRWEDLREAIAERTALPYALFMTVRCAKPGAAVPPATGTEDKRACEDNDLRPEMGRRFWLDMRPREIAALDEPEWLKVIARTVALRGAIVGDQGGRSWGLQFESGEGFLSFGLPNPFAEYAATNPGRTVSGGGAYGYVLRDGVPWRSRLRALAPPTS